MERSFQSLKEQTNSNFQVFFIDYGSGSNLAAKVESLCKEFSFMQYRYCYTEKQPWNKSKALNIVIKELETEFCFVADVDIIFHPEFVETAENLQKSGKTVYFQVGFLDPDERLDNKKFSEFKNFRKSTDEATGLSMFPVSILKKLNGFDEFYHFWGAEDTDIHVRIKNDGHPVYFYDHKILMLHQWHDSYRSKISDNLTSDLQLTNIVRLNFQHYTYTKKNNVKKVNSGIWGRCMTRNEFEELENAEYVLVSNQVEEIDHLLYALLPQNYGNLVKYRIIDFRKNSLKKIAKRILGKKLPDFYDLKQVNDKILLQLLSFYRNKPYNYYVDKDLKYIEFSIDFRQQENLANVYNS